MTFKKIKSWIINKILWILLIIFIVGFIALIIDFFLGMNWSMELYLIVLIFIILLGCAIKYHSKVKNGGFG